MRLFLIALTALSFATAASASSFHASEVDQSGGDFSNSHAKPSVIASGVNTVFGGQKSKVDSDWFMFEGFTEGTKQLDFTFTNEGASWGGLNIRIKNEAFKKKHDWYPLVFQGSFDKIADDTPLTFSYILDGYTGPLYLAFDFYKDNDFKNGNGIDYMIAINAGLTTGIPNQAPAPGPAPIPLPAGLPLALAGLGALAVLRRYRR